MCSYLRGFDAERRVKFHPYEGHSLATVVYPIRLMADLGVQDIISTFVVLSAAKADYIGLDCSYECSGIAKGRRARRNQYVRICVRAN